MNQSLKPVNGYFMTLMFNVLFDHFIRYIAIPASLADQPPNLYVNLPLAASVSYTSLPTPDEGESQKPCANYADTPSTQFNASAQYAEVNA